MPPLVERSSDRPAFCPGCGQSIPRGTTRPSLHGACLARPPTGQADARATPQTFTRTVTARDRARRVIGEAARVLHCAACGERLSHGRGVLFQGNDLLHAGCWRERKQEASGTAIRPPV